MAGKSYRDLEAWQKAVDFVEMIYRITHGFPSEERFGLTNQLRRAAVSVPSNIAEGQGRRSGKNFARFLAMALGSLAEVETQLLISMRLGYINSEQSNEALHLAGQVGRLISGLRRSLKVG